MVRQVLAVACLAVGPAAATRASISPVQKVLDMLSGMKTKGGQMMEAEQGTYATYKEWVSDQTKDLGFQIKASETKIDELLALIAKSDSDVKTLADEIGTLDSDIDRMDGEKKDATAIRDAEKADFDKSEQDYSESVDALSRAIQTMQAQDYDRPQAEAFLQRVAKTTPAMRTVLAAFLQQQQEESTVGNGAPAVAAYASQGGGVIEMLEGLLTKFKGQLSDTVTEESEKAHSHDLVMLHLSDTIKKSSADREEKAAAKASTAAESAQAKGELGQTRTSLAEDKKLVAEMTAEFQTKSATFEANQKVRADELEAIGKAVEIMSSGAAAGSYKKHINLAQVPTASLLQKNRATKHQSASDFLQTRAAALSSSELAALVVRMSASPFAKVIDMIETLLAKLKQSAQDEADHKQWCDEQLKDNKLKRDKKTASVERLSAEVESLDAQISSMGSDIETLMSEQSDLSKAMNEATKQRGAEKAENTQTIADAKAGEDAVKSALVVLREFYDKQSALLQAGQAPEMEAYSGMSSAKGGVVGMMEVIESDFARLFADTTAGEKQASSEYDAFMGEAKADNKQKHKSEVKTRLTKDQAEFDRSNTKKDLVEVEAELSKANEYYEGLKPSCLEVHVSYEERVAKRKQEIESLKEAYKMLAAKGA